MSASIPIIEPTALRAGDTWRWRRELSAYPAPTWELVYTLFSAAAVRTLTAEPDGSAHLISESPEDTAAAVAGRYDWVSHVSDGTDRYQVGAGSIQILPNLSEAASYDGRSHARRMLDAINATLESRAGEGDLDLVRAAFGDRSSEWSLEQLIKLRAQYAAAVAEEEAAERLARGESSGRMLRVRFTA